MALTQEPVPLGVYCHSLLDAIRQSPLAASAMLQRQLHVDHLLHALDAHMGNATGSVIDWPVGYHDPMDISPLLSPMARSEADSMDLSYQA